MPAVPSKGFAVLLTLGLSYLVAGYRVRNGTSQLLGLVVLRAFVQLWIPQVLVWLLWHIILYPKLFSQLRHLPNVPGGSWWNGHASRILREPSGHPAAEW